MGKGPKLGLSFLNSIQICRANDPSTLVKTPLPHSHNSKIHDISLPTFPDPPSSPNHQHEPKSCITHHKSYSKTKREKQKLNHSLPSTDMNARAPIIMSKPKVKVNTSVSPLPSFNNPCSNQLEEPLNTSVRQSSVRTHRFKRYGSKDWKDSSSISKLDNEQSEKVINQSFVVVKRSVDPYQDFKKSMLEMILERQIFEPRDMEQLLMSFLSLNSRMHHKAILKAFSEIWKEVFPGPLN